MIKKTTASGSTPRPRTRRFVAVGVVTASLTVTGAGVAAAVAPFSTASHAVSGALHAVGIDWSAMPDGYTREQYEAFWGAGYTGEHVDALAALWSIDVTQTKARAGQMILDGKAVPVLPGASASTSDPSTAATDAAYEAFWAAGYTADDLAELSALWSTDAMETKARAGQLILDGQTVPVASSGQQ